MTFKSFNEYIDFLKANPNFTGVLIVLHSNGKKELEYNYVNGKRHGKRIEWYENGKKYYEHNYINGNVFGVQFDNEETYEIKPNENNIWYVIVREIL